MTSPKPPRLIPTPELQSFFAAYGISYQHVGALNLGFGEGKDQYQLFNYPGPEDDETMGIFFEWHTGNYFDVDTGPHIAIGLRGPVNKEENMFNEVVIV